MASLHEHNEIYRSRIRIGTVFPAGIKDYRNLIFAVAGLILLTMTGFFLWNRSLRRMVNLRTADLKKSEEAYRSVLENIQDVFYRSDKNGNLILASPSLAKLLGYQSLDECLGRSVAGDFYYEPAKRGELLGLLKAEGSVSNYEVILKRKDGTPVIVETNSHIIYDDNGSPCGVEGVFRDVTERKRHEKELHSSEQMMRAILDSSPIPQFVIDSNHRITHWNRALVKYSGISPEEVTGTSEQWRAFYDHERPCMADLLIDNAADNISEWYTVKHSKSSLIDDAIEAVDFFPAMKNGAGAWLFFTAVPIRDAAKNIIGAVETLADITEQKLAEAALRSGEQRLSSIIDFLPDATLAVDENKRIIIWNRAIEEMTGIPAREMIGKGDHEYTVPFYGYRRSQLMDLFWESDKNIIAKYPDLKQEGENLIAAEVFCPALYNKRGAYLLAKASPLRDSNGKLAGAIECLRDITASKRAQEEQRNNTERLDTLLKINQMAGAPDNRIIEYAFDEAIRLTGSKIGYLGFINHDETIMDVQAWSHNIMHECETNDKTLHFPIENSGLWGEAIRQRRSIITNNYNAPNPLKKGYPEGHIDIKRHMNVPVFSGGKIVLVAGVGNKQDEYNESDVRQITLLMEGLWRIIEHNRSEHELRESRRRLEDIIAFMPDATIVIDRNSRVIAWNRAIEKMTGVMASDILGKGDYEYALPFYNQRRPILIDIALNSDPDTESKYTSIHREGEILFGESYTPALPGGVAYLSGTASVLRDSKGEIFAAIECIRDNTKQKQAEEEQKRLSAQLTQAQKMESVGRLAGGVAHDFNNMLTPIMGYAELLKRDLPIDDPRHVRVNEIIRASERSRDLVRQLLAFARRQTLEMKLADINTIISGFENMLHRTLHENIMLEIKLLPGIGPIMADIGQVEQIIMNLAINAQDAMPEGGTLFIETGKAMLNESFQVEHEGIKPGPYIFMSVRDTGIGIDSETREKIFEPFFTTKDGKGTGLGLATVYGIVKQHGGNISLSSEAGRGTTFHVFFPACSGAVPHPEPAVLPDANVSGNETILVVEDQEQVRNMTVEMLNQCGYKVLEAENVRSALEKSASFTNKIDLLVTDVILPDGNGRELYEKISAGQEKLRVLFMSGYTSDVISHHGVLEAGVQFIHKPFSLSAFAVKVRSILEEG